MNIKTVKNFKHGIIDSVEDYTIPDGAASASNNWITQGDRIELRRGMLLMGTEVSGTGKITCLHTALQADGTEILYKTRGKKIEYYSTSTSDWVEVGSDQLGTAADGEDISMANYHSLAGAQVWINSPNSSLYKIMTANPGSITNEYDASLNYKGYILIKQNRIFLWNRNADKTGIYGSFIDAGNSTTVTNEAFDTGDGGKTYSGTLAFKAAGAKRTCFAIVANDEDSNETFSDNYDGTLTGSAGGSGTINYTTGAITLTFNANVTAGKEIRATYQWEDSTADGIADFGESSPRTAGEGFSFRQDDGGGATMGVASYKDKEYCLHEKKTWELTLTSDDTNATNYIYREKVGIPNWRAYVATGDGIYYVDNVDETDPKIRLLRYDQGSDQVIPISISDNIDLENYRFGTAAMIEWGDYILVACRHKDQSYNNTVLVYSKKWGSWDKFDWWVSCFAIYNGNLYIGDSISNNVFQVWSGLDDDDSTISNSWESNFTNLDVERLKKVKRLIVEGRIGADQSIKVYMSFDNNPYVQVGSIAGNGDYVDRGQAINVGALVVGTSEVGGGGGNITAYHYQREIKINQDKFERIKIKFIAQNIGWADVSEYRFKDIRLKQTKSVTKYRA